MKIGWGKCIILAGTVVWLSATVIAQAEAPQRCLVRDGVARAVIVLPEHPFRAAQLAAQELQYHIELISGTQIPIVAAGQEPQDALRFLVGDSAAAANHGFHSGDFSPQEYAIAFRDRDIVLIGCDKPEDGLVDYDAGAGFPSPFDAQGTLYAAYDFMERFLEVRWYLPTSLGITYTPRTTVTFTGTDVRRRPAMTYRWPFYECPYPESLIGDTVGGEPVDPPLAKRESDLWFCRSRLGGRTHDANHSFYYLYPRFWQQAKGRPEIFEGAHPDWFAKGYGALGRPPQPCLTNPELVAQFIRDARDYFDGKPMAGKIRAAGDTFAIVPDDNSSWCTCDACQAQLPDDVPPGGGFKDRASNYVYGFINQVARGIRATHADAWICTLAYGQYAYPPSHEPLEPNVDVMICISPRNWYNESAKAQDVERLAAWSKTGNRLSLWMYYCWPMLRATWGNYRAFPGFFARQIPDQVRLYRDFGVRGMKYEPSYLQGRRQSPLFDQLAFYVTWRMADDPDQDGDALIDAFFTNYYGPAAKPMRRFMALGEEAYWNPDNHPGNTPRTVVQWEHIGTPETMLRLGECVAQAQALATEDPFKSRVNLFCRGVWTYMQRGSEHYREVSAHPTPMVEAPQIAVSEGDHDAALPWEEGGRMSAWLDINGDGTDKKVEGRVLHDGHHIYFRFVDQTAPSQLRDRGIIWTSDEYELFFARQAMRPVNQMGVDFTGRFSTLRVGGSPGEKWSPTPRIRIDLSTADHWTLYVRFALSEIVPGGIRAGETLYANVLRSYRIKPNQLAVAWNPTMGGYCEPRQFGKIVLLKP